MHRLLLFITILLISYCGRESKEKSYLPKMEFKRTKNPNYSNYFPNIQDTVQQNANKIISDDKKSSEPIPSFTSQPISKQSKKKEKSSGFFTSLFGKSGLDKEKDEYEKICEELLDINKIVLKEQNEKLTSLTSDKKQLVNEINNIEKKLQGQTIQDQKEKLRLETEIDRLNRLIKILSTEIK